MGSKQGGHSERKASLSSFELFKDSLLMEIGAAKFVKDWDEEEKRAREADDVLVNGEGEWDGDTWKWIRVKDGDKVIATFYVAEDMLCAARPRRGKPPNPVLVEKWEHGMWVDPEELWRARLTARSLGFGAQPRRNRPGASAAYFKGCPPAKERQHAEIVWSFGGCHFRSSVLRPVLYKFRDAGLHYVDIQLVQQAIERYEPEQSE